MTYSKEIEQGTTFHWNSEEWKVVEVCLGKDGKEVVCYLCGPSNPWSEYYQEGDARYWTRAEVEEAIKNNH